VLNKLKLIKGFKLPKITSIANKALDSQALSFVEGGLQYIGCVDTVNDQQVNGWVGCLSSEEPVCIKVTKGDEVQVLLANLPRSDVLKATALKSELCGFSIKFKSDNYAPVKVEIMVQAQKLPINKPDFSQRKVFFVHVPKAAGSSINDFLCDAFTTESTYTHIEGIKDQWPSVVQAKYLSGHIRYPDYVENFSRHDFFVFSFLREPLSHLRSHLNWVRRLAEPELLEFRNKHSNLVQSIADELNEFDFKSKKSMLLFVSSLKKGAYGLFDNCQVRFFSTVKGHERVEQKHLNEAILNLKKLHFVGISERSKESQALLATLLNVPVQQEEQRSNVNDYDYGLNIKDAKIKEIVGPLVKFDLALYEVALSIFEAKKNWIEHD
jgi:hypothetical protein